MKWIAISGSWRTINAELASDLRQSVKNIMERGDGIVSGGALGVDQLATEEALRLDPQAKRIKIIIPSSLEIYASHYRKRAEEGVITSKQAEELIGLLKILKDRQALKEMTYTRLDKQSYYARNSEVVRQSDELLAFQVNDGAGTQDAIDKAAELRIPTYIKRYIIT